MNYIFLLNLSLVILFSSIFEQCLNYFKSTYKNFLKSDNKLESCSGHLVSYNMIDDNVYTMRFKDLDEDNLLEVAYEYCRILSTIVSLSNKL